MSGISTGRPYPNVLKYPPTLVEALTYVRGLRKNDSSETEIFLAKLESIALALPARESQMETLRAIAFVALATEYLMSDTRINPAHKSTTLVHVSDMWKTLDKFWLERAKLAYGTTTQQGKV